MGEYMEKIDGRTGGERERERKKVG